MKQQLNFSSEILLRLSVGIALLLIAIILANAPRSRAVTSQTRGAPVQLSGDAARDYLAQPGEGQSLMAAVTRAMFGLQARAQPPSGAPSGAGYLAMSHDQNLQAWFGKAGMTVRPTVPVDQLAEAWQMEMQLKAYGYGRQLADVPPIVSADVKSTRIEYHRRAGVSAIPQSETRTHLIEWYENRAEGIEQGFTLSERPRRVGDASESKPLRVLLALSGDLRAELPEDGQSIVLSRDGKPALSYSKLIAEDADGRKLASHMETSADGREIALVVDDAEARYPIVIDPIVASLEQKLDTAPYVQAESRFGFAVAIDGNYAVVGASREDISSAVDSGIVYLFARSGSSWSLVTVRGGSFNGTERCGYSVAIMGGFVVYGCPDSGGTGKAFRWDIQGNVTELVPANDLRGAGDQYGAAVAVNFNNILVGAPLHHVNDSGLVHLFDAAGSVLGYFAEGNPGDHSGAAVALDVYGTNMVVAAPTAAGSEGAGSGHVTVYSRNGTETPTFQQRLFASDAAASDNFGHSVSVDDNTLVVGADQDDNDRGVDAGAAYVFVRDESGDWSEQQKLTASDGKAGDRFGYHAVAVEGNLIAVGAYAHDGGSSDPADDRGAVWLFTRSGTEWALQRKINPSVGISAPKDEFGVGVDISRDTVVVGALLAAANDGTARAGAAYVYRLDCVPPDLVDYREAVTVCPGRTISLQAIYQRAPTQPRSIQWRKDGVNIAGATSDTYTISNVTPSDAGRYDVVVSNSCGSETGNVTRLALHSFTLGPTAQTIGAAGSDGIVNVTSPGNCAYTASSDASWIRITSGASGTTPGTVGFTVDPTSESEQRTGTLTIGGQVFTITQDGLDCSYAVAPLEQSFDANGGANSASVSVTAGCAWSAASNAPFITINSGATGTGSGTVNYSIAPNHSPTQRSGTLTVAGQTITVTQAPASLLGNISTRLRVEQGDNALIGGFIITGNVAKRLMLRAIGPSLPVEGALADPQLQIFDSAGEEVAFNNNWREASNRQEIIDSTIAPGDDRESAILRELTPGAYTAVVRGVGDTTGVGLIEAYDLGQGVDAKLANISTRGLVQTGGNVMIGGFFVLGAPQKVIVRAIGPSLDVNGRLEDPVLELFNGNGDPIAANNNWKDTQQQEIEATTIPPSNDLESAIVTSLAPAPYTAVVRGVNDTNGVALVEVYALD